MEFYKCEFCNGKGSIFFTDPYNASTLTTTGIATCTVCYGKKKVDWVTNVIKPKGYIPERDIEIFNREIWHDGSVVYVKKIGA